MASLLRKSALAGLVLMALVAGLAAQDAPPRERFGQSFAPLIERTAPAVVNIYTRKIVRSRFAPRRLDGSAFWRLFRDTLLFGYGQDRIENSLGSGVIVSADGVIVTNHHVVADADGVLVALNDGRVYQAQILVSDRRTDVSVLSIKAEAPLPFIAFGDSDTLRVGDQVVAIGNPFGLGQTVTSGIVSALARTSFGVSDIRFFIQTDAAINPGNSGGAQIDLDGRLVGINTAIYSTSGGSQGLGFAIPSNMVRPIVESAVAGRPLVHPWLGISGRRVPQSLARALGLRGNRGVLTVAVHKDSPAAAAGIVPGDVIVAIDGVAVDDPQALRYRIATRKPGDTVALATVRSGNAYTIQVKVVAPPEVPPRDEKRLAGLNPFRGATVASLSPALAEEIGADSGKTGVVVLGVREGSAAARLGLRRGDIIGLLDSRKIETVSALEAFRIDPFKPWRMIVSRNEDNITIVRPSLPGIRR